MNIIRTKAMELDSIPAIAYKQKLKAGGAGMRLHRLDCTAAATFTLDKRTGDAIPYGKVDEKLFTAAAVAEAIELVSGLPYTANCRVVIDKFIASPEPDVEEEEAAAESSAEADSAEAEIADVPATKTCMLNSPEYKALITAYAGVNGRLDYKRMNKDMIQFATKSRKVAEAMGKGVPMHDLVLFVITSRAASLAKQKEPLCEVEGQALIDTLNEIDPRSAFKELNAHLRRMASAGRR